MHEFTYLSSMHGESSTVLDRQPLVKTYWKRCDPFYVEGPGSESFEQFIERVKQVMADLKSLKVDTIAIFSHEQFIHAFLWLSLQNMIELRKR